MSKYILRLVLSYFLWTCFVFRAQIFSDFEQPLQSDVKASTGDPEILDFNSDSGEFERHTEEELKNEQTEFTVSTSQVHEPQEDMDQSTGTQKQLNSN